MLGTFPIHTGSPSVHTTPNSIEKVYTGYIDTYIDVHIKTAERVFMMLPCPFMYALRTSVCSLLNR